MIGTIIASLVYITCAALFFYKSHNHNLSDAILAIFWLPLLLFMLITLIIKEDREDYDDAMRTKSDGTKMDIPPEI